MIAWFNGLSAGLVAPHAAAALMRGDLDSLALASAVLAGNLAAVGCYFFGGRR